jgi:cobalt/nickel transport system permease protein
VYYELLENIAQQNALRELNPYVKLMVGFGAIILALISSSFVTPLFLAGTLSITLLLIARIDARLYLHLLKAPLVFAIVSVAAIILITGGGEVFWSWQPASFLSFSVTSHSINEGLLVFCRVLGGMSALFFISLTTPMTELFIVMRQSRIPPVIIDLAMFIYRSIFLLMDQVDQIRNAQLMRLGYSSPGEAIRSFGNLCGSVFIASWDAGEDLIRAMDARCYDGRFAMLDQCCPPDGKTLCIAVTYLACSAVLLIMTSSITLV